MLGLVKACPDRLACLHKAQLSAAYAACLVHHANQVVDVLLPVPGLAALDEVLPLLVKPAYTEISRVSGCLLLGHNDASSSKETRREVT